MSQRQTEPPGTASRHVQRWALRLAARLGIGPGEADDARAYWWTLALLIAGAVAAVGLAIGFSELGEALKSPRLTGVDDWAAAVAMRHRTPLGTRWARAFTFAGEAKAYLALLAPALLWLLWMRRPWEAGFLLVVAVGDTAIMWALKSGYMRPRPLGEHLAPTVGSSFPSGHSMLAAGIYMALAYLSWNWMPWPAARWLAAGVYSALILAIGLSRIYLGVHWLSDVAAGFLAGAAWAITCALGLEWLRWRQRRQAARQPAGHHPPRGAGPPATGTVRAAGEDRPRLPLWVPGAALMVGVSAVIAFGYASARRQDHREALAQALAASRLPARFEYAGRRWQAEGLEEASEWQAHQPRPVGRLADGHLLYAPPGGSRRKRLMKVEEPASLAGSWVEYAPLRR